MRVSTPLPVRSAVLLLLVTGVPAAATITVAPIGGAVTANSMAAALLNPSSGIVINSATYVGANGASGTFNVGTDIVGIDRGILLTSGSVFHVPGPNDDPGAGDDNALPGDAALNALIPGGATQDASVLTIHFTPTGNQVRFSYVFASEEYNEFVGSEFNDVFAFFVGGVNYAVLPGTNTPVAINNVNCGNPPLVPPTNCSYFIDNEAGGLRHADGRDDDGADLHGAGQSGGPEHHPARHRRRQRRDPGFGGLPRRRVRSPTRAAASPTPRRSAC
ncbi:MAG: choice-of-anchor L domain-containing protein [Thermoanaerobaculia bacterium]